MSTSGCWELTCDGLVSHPGEVKDSHPFNTTETEDKRLLHVGHLALKGFSLLFLYIVLNFTANNFAYFL